jgi:hypothetical protein
MSVGVYSMFVLFCVLVEALRLADPPSKESYRLCMDEETEKAAKVHKGHTAIDICLLAVCRSRNSNGILK